MTAHKSIPPTRKARASYVELPITEVKDDPNNENVHTDEQLVMLRASIRMYGQEEDILIDRKHVCIAGHGIKQAMLLEGCKTISCKYSDLKGAKRAGYRIAANQLERLSHFDPLLLERNVRAISKEMGNNFDPELLAMTQAEYDSLFHPQEWKSRLAINPDSIGDYDPADEVHTIKINGVKASDKEGVMTRVVRALRGTGYEAQLY